MNILSRHRSIKIMFLTSSSITRVFSGATNHFSQWKAFELTEQMDDKHFRVCCSFQKHVSVHRSHPTCTLNDSAQMIGTGIRLRNTVGVHCSLHHFDPYSVFLHIYILPFFHFFLPSPSLYSLLQSPPSSLLPSGWDDRPSTVHPVSGPDPLHPQALV